MLNVARFKVGWSRCSPLNAALYALVNLGGRKDAFKRSRGS